MKPYTKLQLRQATKGILLFLTEMVKIVVIIYAILDLILILQFYGR